MLIPTRDDTREDQWRENDIQRSDMDDTVVTVWGVVIVGALAELSDEGRREIMERQQGA